MTFPIKAVSDCIIVLRDLEPEGLIQLVTKDVQNTGTVMSAGPGKRLPNGRLTEMPVKVGDRIIFSHYVDFDTMGHAIMRTNDVIGLL